MNVAKNVNGGRNKLRKYRTWLTTAVTSELLTNGFPSEKVRIWRFPRLKQIIAIVPIKKSLTMALASTLR